MKTRRTRSIVTATAVAAMLCVALAAAPAARANDVFNAQNFAPTLDPYGYVTVEGAKTLEPLQPFAAAYFNWAHRPLVFRGGGQSFEVIDNFYSLDLVGSIGLLKWDTGGLQAGVDLPLHFVDPHVTNVPFFDDKEGPHGDLRTDVKASFFDRESDYFGLAARMYIEWPTGPERSAFVTNSHHFAVGWEGTIEGKIDFVRGALSLGYEWLDSHWEGGPWIVDDQLKLGFAIAVAPLRDIAGFETAELVFELTHWTVAARAWDHEAMSPVEALFAMRYNGLFFGELGVGGGLNDGFGAPDVRVTVAVGYTF